MSIDKRSSPRHRTYCRVRRGRCSCLRWVLGSPQIVGQTRAIEKLSAVKSVEALVGSCAYGSVFPFNPR